ncbi:MAG: prepilin-type N-terminal cleavage/methylation domain-containing protein [Acidobacteriota bacterium]|nr:prepilin-type N-terminal cleavage/methylation domain-containing protein [Acidobacteriota bacterium]
MAHVHEHSPSVRPVKSPSQPSDERGFTLVEAMVAMVILTIGLVSLAELLAVSLRMQQLGRNETQAVRLTTDKLDQLNSLNFDTALTIQIGGSLTANVANHFDTDVPGYTRRWLVEAGPDGNANLRQITIRVIPTNTDARVNSSFEMISIIRRI